MSDSDTKPLFDESVPEDGIIENIGYKYIKNHFPDLKINYEAQKTGPILPDSIQYLLDTNQAGGDIENSVDNAGQPIDLNETKPINSTTTFNKAQTNKDKSKVLPSKKESNTQPLNPVIEHNNQHESSFDCCGSCANCSSSFVICNSVDLFGNINWFGLIPLLFSILMLVITMFLWKFKYFFYGPFETKGGVPLFKSIIQNVFYASFWISLIFSSLCYCFLDFYSPKLLTTIFLYISICGISLFDLISICVSPSSKEGEPRFVILLFELCFAIMFFYSTDILIRKRSLFHKRFNRLIYEIGSFFSYFMYVSIAIRLSSYSSIMFAEFPWDCMSTYLILFITMMFLYIMVISNLSIGMCVAHAIGYIIYSNLSVNRNYFSKDAVIVFYLIHSLALMLMITSLLTHKTIRRGIIRRDIGLVLFIGELSSLSTFCGPMFLDSITMRPDRISLNFNDVVLFTNLSAGLGFGFYLSITVCLVILGLFIVFILPCEHRALVLLSYVLQIGAMIALHFNYLMMMRKMCDEGLNSMIITFFAMAISHFLTAFLGLCYLFASSGMLINFLYLFVRLSTMFYFIYFGACHIVQYFSYLLDSTIIFYLITGLFYQKARNKYEFFYIVFEEMFGLYDGYYSPSELKIDWIRIFLFFSFCSEICYHSIFSILPVIGLVIALVVVGIILIPDIC